MAWLEFGLAFAVFFLTHSLPVRPTVRPWLVGRLGARGFTFAYSLLSLASLTWLVVAAGRAPFVLLWDRAVWQTHLAITLMLAACLLLAFALGRPNPFSFGGMKNESFDPVQPGVVRLLRHPLLAVLAIWAAVHLLVNGDLAHAILFGIFTVFAVLGSRLVDRRTRRTLGDQWIPLWQTVTSVPLWAAIPKAPELALRTALGVALFVALLWLHPIVIGVSPLP